MKNEVEGVVFFGSYRKRFEWPESAAIVGSDGQKMMLCTRERRSFWEAALKLFSVYSHKYLAWTEIDFPRQDVFSIPIF